MPILGVIASSITGNLNPPALQGDYWALSTTTLSGAASSITFTGIPQNFTHLQVRAYYSMASAGVLKMNFNTDTGANYKSHWVYADGSSTQAGVSSVSPNAINSGYIGAGSSFGATIIDILDYTNTIKNKVARSLDGNDRNGAGDVELSSGLWINTNPITSITLAGQNGNLGIYSSFALYGVK